MINEFGNNVTNNPSLYGYEFGKPCKFPFRLNKTLFYGCIWSSEHDLVGPWCFTETTNQLGYTHSPIHDKWGICSDNCVKEDCPACEENFLYNNKNYSGCTNEGWPNDNAYHFWRSEWCFVNNQTHLWKFCSNSCKPRNRRTSSLCTIPLHNSQEQVKRHHIDKKHHSVIYRYYENITSNCTSHEQLMVNEWCPVLLDKSEIAVCSETCE